MLTEIISYISSVIVFIMPKVRRTSYNMAFKLKVVTEAEAVESSEITWLVSQWFVDGEETRPGEAFQRRAEDVWETNNAGPLYSKVSRARPADVGMVFRPKGARWVLIASRPIG